MTDLAELDYEHEGTVLHGRLARPKQTGLRPAVLVMHHATGQCHHDCKRAQDLADEGYIVLVCDMYGTGLRKLTPEEYFPIFRKCQEDVDFLRARVAAGYEALKAVPDVDPNNISAIGFCFGGQCVLELARSGAELRGVVSLHGLLKTQRPAVKDQFKAKACILTGALDPYAPIDDVAAFQKEMNEADVDYHLTVYGQGYHAFTDPEVEKEVDMPGLRYDPVLDSLSWTATTAFLAATFQPA